MTKYELFRKLLALVEIETNGKVTDADLNYYNGGFRISGENEDMEIVLDVMVKTKERAE